MQALAKLRGFGSVAAAALVFSLGAQAQDQQEDRLADIRLQLLDLYGQMEQLRRELTPSGSEPMEVGISELNALQRLDGLEQELRGSIAKIEELEFRILRIAADGNNQIRDLEFQLAEIAGTDLSEITEGVPLGTQLGQVTSVATDDGSAVSVSDLSGLEREMFEQAFKDYQNGSIASAKKQFETLIEAYPGGRFVADAYYYLGETFVYEQAWADAGRAFLASFNQEQDGPTAPKALLRLGESLVQHGNPAEACKILKTVGARFPDSGEAGLADAQIAGLDCG